MSKNKSIVFALLIVAVMGIVLSGISYLVTTINQDPMIQNLNQAQTDLAYYNAKSNSENERTQLMVQVDYCVYRSNLFSLEDSGETVSPLDFTWCKNVLPATSYDLMVAQIVKQANTYGIKLSDYQSYRVIFDGNEYWPTMVRDFYHYSGSETVEYSYVMHMDDTIGKIQKVTMGDCSKFVPAEPGELVIYACK